MHTILEKVWGYTNFRPMQEQIMLHGLNGSDCIVLMPTGGGKSICYQLPTLATKGWTLVISPLISLIQDQERSLIERNIPVVALHSGLHSSVIKKRLLDAQEIDSGLIFLSPERLASEAIFDFLRHLRIKLIAVDEAHCISQWGHDFRPSYLKLVDLRLKFPSVPIMALTGTATQPVLKDIQKYLGLRKPEIFKSSFARPNIDIIVFEAEQKWGLLRRLLIKNGKSSIVYLRSRRKVMELSAFLVANGISCLPYHAGLDPKIRQEHQTKWIADQVQVMVATSAFGMGVDKPDVRFVYHLEPPASPEEYYQEIGRAGRDGDKSFAILLYHESDQKKMIEKFQDEKVEIKELLALHDYLRKWIAESGANLDEAVGFDLDAFCQWIDWTPRALRKGLRWLNRHEYVTVSEGVLESSRVHIYRHKSQLSGGEVELEPWLDFVRVLLRMYEGVLSHPIAIHEPDIAKQTELPVEQVVDALMYLDQKGYLHYFPSQEGVTLTLHSRAWNDGKELAQDYRKYSELLEGKKGRLKSMMQLVREDACRQRFLLRYFAEDAKDDCGHCDVCYRRKMQDSLVEFSAETKTAILDMLDNKLGVALTDLILEFPLYHKNVVLSVLKKLMSDDRVVVSDQKVFKRRP